MKRGLLFFGLLLTLAGLIWALAPSSSAAPLEIRFSHRTTNSDQAVFYAMLITNVSHRTVDVWHCLIDVRLRMNGAHTPPRTINSIRSLPPQNGALLLCPSAKENHRQASVFFRVVDHPWAIFRQARTWFKTRRWPARGEIAPDREILVNVELE